MHLSILGIVGITIFFCKYIGHCYNIMQFNYCKNLIEKNHNCKIYNWYWKYIYHVQQKTNITKDMFYHSVFFSHYCDFGNKKYLDW